MIGTRILKIDSKIAEIIDAKVCPRKWQKTKSRLTYGTPCRYLPCSVKVSPHFLDSKFKDVCLFAQVGSYSYDDNRMLFDVSTLGYIQQSQSITLDYKITINNLSKQDKLFNGGALGNFSLAGFELVRSD